ncbi:hypothetical protein [Syntrophomonas palmitatica]|uniref:hypothetical protein n=1 Tax=Syntrophomonas palmitatica TaxID=402877 RepID=UPI0006D03BED|nr:hypothetical protein [Syntrophomonas palmitatica]
MFADGHKYYSYVLVFIALGALVTAIIPRNVIDVFSFGTYTSYVSLVVGIGYPLAYLLLANLRGNKEGSRV